MVPQHAVRGTVVAAENAVPLKAPMNDAKRKGAALSHRNTGGACVLRARPPSRSTRRIGGAVVGRLGRARDSRLGLALWAHNTQSKPAP